MSTTEQAPPLPVWGLLVLLARRSPDGVERWYSQGFYPVWARALITVTSPLPFSLAEGLASAANSRQRLSSSSKGEATGARPLIWVKVWR